MDLYFVFLHGFIGFGIFDLNVYFWVIALKLMKINCDLIYDINLKFLFFNTYIVT